MLRKETLIINGEVFVRTYSDIGYLLERDGVVYSEAIDPEGTSREYQEVEPEDTEATEADYLAALDKLGVSADD